MGDDWNRHFKEVVRAVTDYAKTHNNLVGPIGDYARYNLWANQRICKYLNQCTEEEFYSKNI